MIKRDDGFTFVELIITMAIFLLVMTAASGVFSGLLTQFKQQSRLAESNIEGVVGLEILRKDIDAAGYGLPWNGVTGIVNYTEADGDPFGLNGSPDGVPKAIVSADNVAFSGVNTIFDGSDYLVIRSVEVAGNASSKKWTLLRSTGPRAWTPAAENLASTDHVIVINPGATTASGHTLINSGGAFTTTYGASGANLTAAWRPSDISQTYVVYGIDPTTALSMPFNRADYFIRRFDEGDADIAPKHCAPNTGILEKAVLSHVDGTYQFLHLLDCVADMQVVYGFDDNNNGTIGTYTDGSTTVQSWPVGTPDETLTIASVLAIFADPAELRGKLREVRVYILAHEGQKDMNYTYPSSTITIPASSTVEPGSGLGRTYNLATLIGDPEYKHYRWKVYRVVGAPNSLR